MVPIVEYRNDGITVTSGLAYGPTEEYLISVMEAEISKLADKVWRLQCAIAQIKAELADKQWSKYYEGDI